MLECDGQAGDEVVICVSALRAFLKGELDRVFSQFGYDQGPAEYEVDYIVGGIVELGTGRHEHRRDKKMSIL